MSILFYPFFTTLISALNFHSFNTHNFKTPFNFNFIFSASLSIAVFVVVPLTGELYLVCKPKIKFEGDHPHPPPSEWTPSSTRAI